MFDARRPTADSRVARKGYVYSGTWYVATGSVPVRYLPVFYMSIWCCRHGRTGTIGIVAHAYAVRTEYVPVRYAARHTTPYICSIPDFRARALRSLPYTRTFVRVWHCIPMMQECHTLNGICFAARMSSEQSKNSHNILFYFKTITTTSTRSKDK